MKIMLEIKMIDLGLMRYFLGIQVRQEKGKIILSQEKYERICLKNVIWTSAN